MTAFEHTPPVSQIVGLDAAVTLSAGSRSFVVPALIAGSWAALLVAEATGFAAALHHHALIEGGPPLSIAIPLFLVAWMVMVAAMMLPASLPTFDVLEAAASRLPRPRRARTEFLAWLALAWTAFGLVAFLGDVGLHALVDATPWLAARPWLIEAGILALAGGYQLVPLKRHNLAACRPSADGALSASITSDSAGRLGRRHALSCLGSSWALMLLMFAEGFGSLGWMVGLAALMTYEATGRHGQRAATIAGVALILTAIAVLSGVPAGGL